MQIYVSADAPMNGWGTKEAPYRTISEAARIAVCSDEVLVAPGLYREYVDPVSSGVKYVSEVKHAAVISGAETVRNWIKHDNSTWTARISNGVFGSYNPYTTIVRGDWYFAKEPVHTGEVYLNGKAMYEVPNLEDVLNPVRNDLSWDPEGTMMKWYTEQDGNETVIYANFQGADPNVENVEINVRRNCFMPGKTGVDNITLSGFTVKQAATTWAPPTAYQDGMIGPHWSRGWIIEDCKISDSRCSGISLGKYLQPYNENKWTTKRFKDGTQNERDIICMAQYEGWTKERIGSHIVRRCEIHDCGQTGIVGHLGCVFSIIEDNHIHHINNKQDLAGAEIGGIKMHAAIDVIFRRNHIHHCTRGIWLDWQAQGTRVTQNLLHDNMTPTGTKINSSLSLGEDIFVEVSHGPTLIDNNLLLSICSCRLATQGLAFVHNLIAGSFTSVGSGTDNGAKSLPSHRYTPYHVSHRTEVAGFMTFLHGDARFYNNIFVQQQMHDELAAFVQKAIDSGATGFGAAPNMICGTKPYDGYPTEEQFIEKFSQPEQFGMFSSDKYYEPLPVYTNGNVFFNGAKPCDKELNYAEDTENKVYVKVVENDGAYSIDTNIQVFLPRLNTISVSTEVLGEAFEPEEKFENPDGTAIIFDQDYFGGHRGLSPLPGPFESTECFREILYDKKRYTAV